MKNTIILNNGVELPLVGIGTYALKDPKEQVVNAINAGYRLIDTALDYDNEELVGEAIKASGINRDEIFLTTKVWFRWYKDHQARKQVEDALKKLKVNYLDMVMIHWPLNDYYAAYRDLEDLYDEGIIRAIGVCNFTSDRLYDLVSFNDIKPQVNQIETHIYCKRLDEHKWMDELDVVHQAYSPLGAGRIDDFLNNEIINNLAIKYNKTPAQICLKYLVSRNISILPRTNSVERLKENIDLFDFELNSSEIELINTIQDKQAVIGRPEDPNKVKRAITTYR